MNIQKYLTINRDFKWRWVYFYVVEPREHIVAGFDWAAIVGENVIG